MGANKKVIESIALLQLRQFRFSDLRHKIKLDNEMKKGKRALNSLNESTGLLGNITRKSCLSSKR